MEKVALAEHVRDLSVDSPPSRSGVTNRATLLLQTCLGPLSSPRWWIDLGATFPSVAELTRRGIPTSNPQPLHSRGNRAIPGPNHGGFVLAKGPISSESGTAPGVCV